MKEFDILGANHFALSMILETLATIHKEVKVFIYTNTEKNAHKERNIPYAPGGVIVEERKITEYEDAKRICYIAGMSPRSREMIYNDFKALIDDSLLQPLIFPNVILASSVQLGVAVRIENSCNLGPFVVIQKGAFVNRMVSIGHHTLIESYVNLNPGALINGECIIGARSTIGAGAIINDRITIGEGSIIGSGSVVTKNIPAGVVAFGSPAKIIRKVDPSS